MDEKSEGTQLENAPSTDVLEKNANDDGAAPPATAPPAPPPCLYLGEECSADSRLCAAAARLGELVPPEPGPAPPERLPPGTCVVCHEFDGALFDAIYRGKHRILGPTAVRQLADRGELLPNNARPLYTLAMRGAVICFTGFRKKDELTYLITLIHYMGGSIRKDMSARVTHLIASVAGGDKYRYAAAFRLPVLSRSWVDAAWERRHDDDCIATDDSFMNEHKLKVFAGARVCFVGFPEEECQHMADVLAKNGGETCQLDDHSCTHVVMANGETYGRSLIVSPKSSRHTPSPPKPSLYRRLSARLSTKRASPKLRGTLSSQSAEHTISSNEDSKDSCFTLEQMGVEEFKVLTQQLRTQEQNTSDDSSDSSEKENNKDAANLVVESDVTLTIKDKRALFKKRTLNISAKDNEPSSGTKCNAISSSPFGRKLLDEISTDEPDRALPSLHGAIDQFVTDVGLSTGKKRCRTSTDSATFQVALLDENIAPDKACEESDWKSPFKRLKIKDSFRFKNRPTIFKREKKTEKPANFYDGNSEKGSPAERNLSDEYMTSTPSPKRNDANDSEGSANTSNLKNDKSIFSNSGLFDISFASLRGSKPVKSASKLRRSVKSFTASFRSERKKKYEKRAETITVGKALEEQDSLTSFSKVSTPIDKFDKMALDLSPVENNIEDIKTPLSSLTVHNSKTDIKTLHRSQTDDLESTTIFKTPRAKGRIHMHRHSICGGTELLADIKASILTEPVIHHRVPLRNRDAERNRLASKHCLPALPIQDGHALSVVDEHSTTTVPECSAPKVQIVKAEWFWASVQNEEAQDEKDYLFADYLESLNAPSRRSSHASLSGGASEASAEGTPPPPTPAPLAPHAPHQYPLPHHLNRMRKRKLRGGDSALHKRRSSVGDAVMLSLSSGLLDCTPSPDGKQLLDEAEVPDNVVRKLMSPRQQVFCELLQTESNYVNILHTIVTMFKQPLEDMSEEESDTTKALLNNTELKIIFGNLPPIYELHSRMLEELKWASQNWSEDVSIGRLVLKYAPDMVKAYPPFVNFFENTKEMLAQCDKDKPRFHAFLKICQTKPECGRQSLQELLIRPVQRLPSISLLLDDILKHTHKANPDHAALVSALAGVREVMTHINEDKRKTEGQLQMFDIYNEIDNCPPHLVSSHRTFVSRCEVVELSKDLSGRGDHLVLFLFTDTMEVCKRRSKTMNNKSPTGTNGLHHTAGRFGSNKPYRHVQLMPLSTVKRVIDVRETDDCHNVFALMCRSNQELKEKLYSFMITDENVEKTHFLRTLCRQMANTVCKADAEKFLACLESHQLDIDTSDIALGTLSKAFKFASRTRIKLESMAQLPGWLRGTDLPHTGLLDSWVLRAHFMLQVGRAFSFNKTPSKLKRAMSSMISPFGSTSALTPASQLAQMRLASCNNINELGVSNNASNQSEVLVAPLSVQPQRKAKATSLSAAAVRRF